MPRNFFTELKRPGPNIYKFVVSFVPCGETSRLSELARVLVRPDHVASIIVNANHCAMGSTATEWQRIGNQIDAVL